MKITKRGILGFSFLAIVGLAAAQAQPGEAQLIKEARVTKTQAEKIALKRVPHGTIKSGEIEKEHGRLVWSFDIARSGSRSITEVQVDAKRGSIVSIKNESPAQQAAEDRADKAKQ